MRLPEDHLSPQELASLPDSPPSTLHQRPDAGAFGGVVPAVLEHLRRCEACAALAEDRWRMLALAAGAGTEPAGECPSAEAWLAFAAGEVSGQGLRQSEAERMAQHAAGCRRCAEELRDAMQLMQMDEAEVRAEASALPELASATPAWQAQMARRLAAEAALPAVGKAKASLARDQRSAWSAWVAMPVAAALLVALGLALWPRLHPSDDRLLALAYNKQRTLELRLPGGDPVPMASITRSGESRTHGLPEPAELLELQLRAQQHLDRTPESPYWHQRMGEVDLLQGNAEGARRNFEFARTSGATLPHLLPDLADAYFELGDASGDPTDYARAAELYLEELRALASGRPGAEDAALLHYNLALCWERQNLPGKALDQMRQALGAETDPGWRRAIQAEIDRLAKAASASAARDPLRSDGYEAALAEALAQRLPQWATHPEVRAWLGRVAALGVEHHDRWLAEWIAAPHTRLSQQADASLAAAQRATMEGRAEESLTAAQQALRQYTAAHHAAGVWRARYAEAYALQRLGRSAECLRTAHAVSAMLPLADEAPLLARALLEEGICTSRAGDLEGAQPLLERALTAARFSASSQVEMNVLSMQASNASYRGLHAAAWQLDVTGLGLCREVACPAARQYKFLFTLVEAARDLGLTETAAALMETAAPLAASSDPVTHAYAYETLGVFAARARDFAAAQRAFDRADEIAAQRQAALSALNRADWKLDRAEVLARRSLPQAALEALQQGAPSLLASDYQPGRVRLFEQVTASNVALGRYEEALESANHAVGEAERSLGSLHTAEAREHWSRQNSGLYGRVVEVYLRRGEAAEALAAWERYRAAPYVAGALQGGGGAPRPEDAASQGALLADRSRAAPAPERVVIVARVGEAYVGWLATARPLHVERVMQLGEAERLHAQATLFYRLCADRDSSLADLRSLGATLYGELLAPLLAGSGSGQGRVWLDLDPSLEVLPVAALRGTGGWLGDAAPILLPAWWSERPAAAFREPAATPALHLVLVNGFDAAHREASEAAELARTFPRSRTVSAAAGARLEEVLGGAEMLHFSGHAERGAALLEESAGRPEEALTAERVSRLSLARCRLAVLAACNTSEADPDRSEALPALRNALLLSGAQAVVASAWDVDDRSTRSLMLAFYKQLALGLSPSRSLQQAQAAVRSSAGWQHPYFWAPFQLYTH